MTVYRAVPGSRLTDEDAAIIGPHLEQLAQRGPLSAHAVVDDARPPESPLHPYFEWDDAVAAEEYRREQARHMLRSIAVEIRPGDEPVRAFHLVTVPAPAAEDGAEEEGERGYLHIDAIRRAPDLLKQIIDAERRTLEGCRRRLSQYEQLRPAAALVSQAIAQLAEVPQV